MSGVDPAGGPVGQQVRKAEQTDVESISRALGAAFEDDPVMSWLIRDPGRRPDVLAGNFRMLLEEIWLDHEVTYTTATTAGAAIWDPPGKWSVSIPRQVALLPRALSGLGPEPAAGAADAGEDRTRPSEPGATTTSPSSGSSRRARAAASARP